jgi:hypothetical protein
LFEKFIDNFISTAVSRRESEEGAEEEEEEDKKLMNFTSILPCALVIEHPVRLYESRGSVRSPEMLSP